MSYLLKKYYLLCYGLLLITGAQAVAQTIDPSLFNCMQWRMIGPFRGGRTVGASGDRLHPNVFYMGVNNGGVWKTNDYGRTWNPVFDDQPTGSIGDVAVAPSNPDVIYAGSGEGIQRPDLSVGDGIYKSTDGGKTWRNMGLHKAQQIGGLAIDPQNENRVFAAALGHPYGANTERGVYRSLNGGQTWEKVLYIDENTGAIQVTIDPADPKIVYADLLASRLAPWENGEWKGSNSGLFKSVDGGTTWRQLRNGLPTTAQGLDRIGFCIAPSDHNRMYAVVSANSANGGLYRSNDAGESWTKLSSDIRLWERGTDFAEVKVDPKNPDIVYDANVVVWKSMDGGKTWKGWKGAPGGDDYHRLWINPDNPDVILLANDQGAVVTVNGGQTWSSWYNQPTAQLYHVSADNAFPYNVYSGQQESGSVGIASRGNDGAVSFREWQPVGAEEYGYVVADPLDPDIIYGGKISRYDKRTGQSQNISPDVVHSGNYRFIRTAPIVFSPVDNRSLFYAGNVVFKTRDGGSSWQVVSPDLTRPVYDSVPACIGIYRTDSMRYMPRRGVIYTLAPSPVDSNTLWAGTDDGWIWVTRDGGANWQNVTPPGVTVWSKISLMDASHTGENTAYAAVNRIRLDDQRPHIYRTRDGGKTWKEIVTGLPDEPINVVKEDPQQKGLLFAGSEHAVYVSFDDGDHWQALRLNMPATSIRDLVIKDNDIAVATHGRSFWILDDITPLRQLAAMKAGHSVILYKPQPACRVRWNMNTDTPLPPDEPVGKNPPDGAIIDYYLDKKASSEITLDIVDAAGATIRHYSSADTLYHIPDVNIPLYWVRPQTRLSGDKGSHRFLWDMHYQPLNVPVSYAMSAIYEDTPPAYTSPWVMPGAYTIKLTVAGKRYEQKMTVYMDPRVKTTTAGLQLQHDMAHQCYADARKTLKAMQGLNQIADQLSLPKGKPEAGLSAEADRLSQKISALQNPPRGSGARSLSSLFGSLSNVMHHAEEADVTPTTQCSNAAALLHAEFEKAWQKWEEIKKEMELLNKQLGPASVPTTRKKDYEK